MRDKIVKGLNDLLEIDHDTVAALMTAEFYLSVDSGLKNHDATFAKNGTHIGTALSIISYCAGKKPILPVFEDGVIQRFE